jgi:hypothetical protein
VFKDILEGHADHVEAHELLAKTYRKMGNPEGALETLEKVMTLEGTRADSQDLDKLRSTLDAYEDTISEFASPLRSELESNVQKLKQLGRKATAAAEQEPDLDFNNLAEEGQPVIQPDAVPIIKFGGQEPVIKIEEEEDTIDLDEMEESLEMERIEIKDETPQSLMSLLDNQKLYDENPNWKDFQLPPMFQERPPQMPRQEPLPEMKPQFPKPPVQESLSPPQQPEGSRPLQAPVSPAQDLLSQSLQESMRAQAQMVDRLAQELRDVSSRMDARPQFVPAPVQPPQMQRPIPPTFPAYQPPPPSSLPYQPPPVLEQPVVPPPGQDTGGIPRFARDFIEEEEEAKIAPFHGPAEPVKRTAKEAMPATAAGKTAVETAEAPEIRRETSPQKTAHRDQKKQGKKDLRQRLKDFLKRIRERLEQRRQKPEGAGKPPVKKASPQRSKSSKRPKATKPATGVPSASPPPEQTETRAQGLMNYLEELTEYLPERRKSSFLHSDARLKIEYIKSRLQGRSGIKNQIESKFTPRVTSSSLDAGKIAETFDFMKNLASYHPDKTLGTMLQSKLNGILHKIRE